MSLRDLAAALQSTALSTAIQTTGGLIPALQAVHILMIGVVFGSILLLTLRVLGLMRGDEPLEQVWRRFAPFFWGGLLTMALTGLVLILAEPVRELMNLSFRLKMLLLALCIASAATLGRRIRAAARAGGPPAAAAQARAAAAPPAPQEPAPPTAATQAPGAAPLPRAIRVTAAATLALWLCVIFLGRAIAYDSAVWGDWSPTHAHPGTSAGQAP